MDGDDNMIGYFAATNRGDVICDRPACIIAGSYKTMKGSLPNLGNTPFVRLKVSL